MGSAGRKVWLVPDAYYPENASDGPYVSHEAICVLNTGDDDAQISITLYFEDQDPVGGFNAVCMARRTNHIRLDKIRNKDGLGIPLAKPYAILLESSRDVVCQYSRLDTTQIQMSLMTTIAY